MKFLKLCLFALLCPLAATAQTQPKVVFLGDWLTAGWDLSSNPNWINKGIAGYGYPTPGQTSGDLAARFQSDVVSLHPAIVHIVTGSVDTNTASPASQPFVPNVVADEIMAMVAEAKAANIKVILGTTPPLPDYPYNTTPVNAWIEAYGAANNIPVINYADALCGCVSSVGPLSGSGYAYDITRNTPPNIIGNAFVPLLETVSPNPGPNPSPIIPSATGYALMTQMAQNTIATVEGIKLQSGWLQNINISKYGDDREPPLPSDVNNVPMGTVIQFVPYGAYSDGSYQALVNTNFAGSSGTWTSSNPMVMSITQSGQAWAISQGQTWITYISPTGVHFSPWGMTVVTCGTLSTWSC